MTDKAKPKKRTTRKIMPDPDVSPDPGFRGGLSYGASGLGPATSGFQWINNPSQEQLLRGYSQSPWPHVKFLRVCSAMAMLDFSVKARRPGNEPAVLPEEYPLWRLLRDPNPVMTSWDFTFLTELYARVTGELFWRIERDGFGRPKSLWVLPRFWAVANRDGFGKVISFTLATRGRPTVPASDMLWLHVPDPIDPYLAGVGDMLAMATEIETFEYASEADKNFFLRDASPSGALVLPPDKNVREEERRKMRQEFTRAFGGFRNYGEVPLLWGGLDFKRLRETRKEMDFIDGQVYLRNVIIAGVHPHILGISQDVNRANAEAAEYTFAKYEILPRARWHQQIWNKFIAPIYDPRVFMEYENIVPEDVDRLLKAALDPLSGELLTVDERLKILARVVPGVEPVGGTYGASYIQVATRVPVTSEGDREPDSARRGATSHLPHPTSLLGLPPSAAKQPDLRDLLSVLGTLDGLVAIFRRHLSGVYEAIVEERWGQAAEEVGLGTAFDVLNPAIVRILLETAGQRIRGISETQLELLRSTLAEGIAAGEGIPALSRRVRAVFEDARRWRAETIARTETIRASNAAAAAVYREAGVELIEWLLAPDYTPEIDHGACEPYGGQVIELGAEFAPGVQFPPLHPNCRCTIAPVIPESSEEGRGFRFRYEGEARARHITALGVTHTRLERVFLNATKRAFQEYQNEVNRRLRSFSA